MPTFVNTLSLKIYKVCPLYSYASHMVDVFESELSFTDNNLICRGVHVKPLQEVPIENHRMSLGTWRTLSSKAHIKNTLSYHEPFIHE